MRRKIVLCAVLAISTSLIYSSCSKIAALIRAQAISFTATDLTFNIPVTTDTATVTSIGSGTFTYNIDSLIRAQTANQLGLANIDTFTLTSCTLTVQNPDDNNNVANFESAAGSFYTSANANPANMGSISNNPDVYGTTLNVPVNASVNLTTYVSPSGVTTFNYSVTGKARRATTKVLNVAMHVTYNIHVSP